MNSCHHSLTFILFAVALLTQRALPINMDRLCYSNIDKKAISIFGAEPFIRNPPPPQHPYKVQCQLLPFINQSFNCLKKTRVCSVQKTNNWGWILDHTLYSNSHVFTKLTPLRLFFTFLCTISSIRIAAMINGTGFRGGSLAFLSDF